MPNKPACRGAMAGLAVKVTVEIALHTQQPFFRYVTSIQLDDVREHPTFTASLRFVRRRPPPESNDSSSLLQFNANPAAEHKLYG